MKTAIRGHQETKDQLVNLEMITIGRISEPRRQHPIYPYLVHKDPFADHSSTCHILIQYV